MSFRVVKRKTIETKAKIYKYVNTIMSKILRNKFWVRTFLYVILLYKLGLGMLSYYKGSGGLFYHNTFML